MPTTVLYDEQCNFCKVIVDTLLTWDRAGRLEPEPIQSARGQQLLADVPPAERLTSFHTVGPDGTLRSAGPALPHLFDQLPGGALVARPLAAVPGPTAAAYTWVATHRVGISRLVPGALKRRANARLAACPA